MLAHLDPQRTDLADALAALGAATLPEEVVARRRKTGDGGTRNCSRTLTMSSGGSPPNVQRI